MNAGRKPRRVSGAVCQGGSAPWTPARSPTATFHNSGQAAALDGHEKEVRKGALRVGRHRTARDRTGGLAFCHPSRHPVSSTIVTTLPQAIQLVLPILASDGGRARVQTLLAIQGAGPDYVRQHLTDIDAALGASSPGPAALADLIRQAEAAVSTPSTVWRQHVISRRGVLRRFTENVPGGTLLARFDLAAGQTQLTGTNGVGYVRDFVPVDSQATECLWQQVETHLTQAITAALNGTATPAHMSTLRHAVALHFVRNPQTLIIHNQSFGDALQDQVGQLANTPDAAKAFRRRYGLVPAGPEALRMGAEAILDRLVQLHKDGGLFRLSVQRLFEMVCDRFDSKGIQILTPASPTKEFLLGDTPALTLDHATGAVGLAQGVTADQADQIFMPLAPRLLVAVGPADGARSIPDDEVDQYNRWQARAAHDYLIHRPGANFTVSIPAWRA